MYTETIAQDGPNLKRRQGPTSLLPKNENQLLIDRYDLGFTFLIWVDATTPTTPKVLNCSKAPVGVPPNKTKWERGYLGNLDRATFVPPYVQCTSAGQPQCQLWQYATTFSCGCAGGSYTGHEVQNWMLAPMAIGIPVTPATVFGSSCRSPDDIIYPKMPQGCPPSNAHKWWHGTWSDISTTVPGSLFDVPADCSDVADASEFRRLWKGGPRRVPAAGRGERATAARVPSSPPPTPP